MPGRVDQVDLVGVAIVGLVEHPDGLRLDRDAPLALEIQLIEHLLDHVTWRDRARVFEQAVG